MRFLLYFSLALIFLNSPVQVLKASNKESVPLNEEDFSKARHIDYAGLAEELRYEFKDKKLLQAALYPLLKQNNSQVQLAKKQFEHLEFFGDSVLGCFIRERLIKLLPDQDRGDLAQLYSSLTENKTLTEVYLRNLLIERYLPFPEKPSCKYCNVVEAIIGAISLDDSINGPKNARKFIMLILDDHLLQEQIKKISGLKHITLTQICLPHVSEALTQVCSPERIKKESPKSLLHEVLSIAWMDYPTYTVTMGKNSLNLPILYAYVSGAQIGKEIENLHGEGYTRQEAEENAAIEALNFLAQQKIISRAIIDASDLEYSVLVERFIDLKRSEGSELAPRTPPHDRFKLQLILNEKVIGEGSHSDKDQAKESAAQQAYIYLSQEHLFGSAEKKQPSKNHRERVKELNDQRNSDKIKLIDIPSIESIFTCQAKIGDRVIGEGIGNSKDSAKEKAAQLAYDALSLELLTVIIGENQTPKNYRTLIQELNDQRDFEKIALVVTSPPARFTCQAKIGDRVIGEGIGNSKDNAREEAARQAFNQLAKNLTDNTDTKKPAKNFRELLEEISVNLDGKIRHLWTYKYILKFGSKNSPIVGNGSTATKAKEKASLAACDALIQFETNLIAMVPVIPKLSPHKVPVLSSKGSTGSSTPTKSSATLPGAIKPPKKIAQGKSHPVSMTNAKTLKKSKIKKASEQNGKKLQDS